MERRDFLGLTTASTGAAALGMGGCVPILTGRAPDSISEGELELKLGRLDAALEDLRGATLFDGMRGRPGVNRRMNERFENYVEATQPRASRAFRSMLTTGVVLDLPPSAREHLEVQRRLAKQSAEFDESMVEMTGLLASLPPQAHTDVEHTVRSDPNFVMDFYQSLDDQAARYGLEGKSRGQLRRAGVNTSFRLKKQPASLLFGEYVSKVERIAARRGADVAAERWLAAEAAEQLIWTPSSGESVSAPAPLIQSGAQPSATPHRTRGIVKAGRWVVGIGFALAGIGGIIAAVSTGAGAITFGVLLLCVGLIGMIVGGIILLAAS